MPNKYKNLISRAKRRAERFGVEWVDKPLLYAAHKLVDFPPCEASLGIANMEHLIHEMSHALSMGIPLLGEEDLSDRVDNECQQLEAEARDNNELLAVAATICTSRKLDLPLNPYVIAKTINTGTFFHPNTIVGTSRSERAAEIAHCICEILKPKGVRWYERTFGTYAYASTGRRLPSSRNPAPAVALADNIQQMHSGASSGSDVGGDKEGRYAQHGYLLSGWDIQEARRSQGASDTGHRASGRSAEAGREGDTVAMSEEDDSKVIPFPGTSTTEPVSEPDWLDLQLLEDARGRLENDPLYKEIRIYAAMLVQEGKEPVVIHFLPEYGDDDGFHTIRDYVRSLRNNPSVLKSGEEIRFQLFILNTYDESVEVFNVWDDERGTRHEPIDP